MSAPGHEQGIPIRRRFVYQFRKENSRPIINHHLLLERAGNSPRDQARREIVAAAGGRRNDTNRSARILLARRPACAKPDQAERDQTNDAIRFRHEVFSIFTRVNRSYTISYRYLMPRCTTSS